MSAWQSQIFVELLLNGNVVSASLAESGTYNFDGTSSNTVVLSLIKVVPVLLERTKHTSPKVPYGVRILQDHHFPAGKFPLHKTDY